MDILSAAWQIDYMSNDNNGQQCVSGQIVLAPEGVGERLAAALNEIYKRKQYGELLIGKGEYDHACSLGPVIDDQAVECYGRIREDAETHGMKVICHGAPKGRLLPPTVILGRYDSERLIMREEAFVPIVSIVTIPAEDLRSYRERTTAILRDLGAYGDLGAAFLTPSPSDAYATDFYLCLPYGLIGVNIWPGAIGPFGPWGAYGMTQRSGNCFTRNYRMFRDDQIEKVLFIFPSPGRHGLAGMKMWQAPWYPPTNRWTTGFFENIVDTYLRLGSDDQWGSLVSLGKMFLNAAMRELTTLPQRAAIEASSMVS